MAVIFAHLGARLGLTGKVLLALATGAMLTLLASALAWFSFQQVATSQRNIIDDAVPVMDAAQAVAKLNIRLIPLVDRLGRSEQEAEVAPVEAVLKGYFSEMHGLLRRLGEQRFEPALGGRIADTVKAIDTNLHRQAKIVRQRLSLGRQESDLLVRNQRAALALVGLSESLVANASTATISTISRLYPLIDADAAKGTVFESLDRLIEVNLDLMERMSELQLVCFKLKTLLEQFERETDTIALNGLQLRFSTQLEILHRRLADMGDPDRRANGLKQFDILAGAVKPDGMFALREQQLLLLDSFQELRAQGSALGAQLSDQTGTLVSAAGRAIDAAGKQSKQAVNQGFISFLLVAALLFFALIATLWVLFHYHVFGRLRGLEAVVRALTSGNYDIDIPASGNDPLAPLSHALEQFRDHARERLRLEGELLRHQEELEGLVASRTAELRKSNALLEQESSEHARARRSAEEANRTKSVFLATLSHELRTPLSGVAGSVQLLGDTGLDVRQREYLRMIRYANTTLLDIVEDMLSFTRLEAGKFDFEVAPFVLRDAIDDMLALQRVSVRNRDIALIRDIAPDVPEVVAGDCRKLNQILLNLIGNAIKFTDEGSVTVSVSVVGCGCGKPGADARLRFTVSDTGIGIPADQCEEVFKPFVQVEDAAHRRQGTGLGLAICQRLIALMHGDIRIESALGQGTQVSFELPFQVASRFSEQAARDVSMVHAPLRPLDVLVVEDDEINRTVCEHYLETLGHQPIALGDGESALELLRQRHASLDVALLDISLPGMSGLEAAREIRQLADGRWASLPIIVMSAHVAGNETEWFTTLGIACFLGKPFDRDSLAKALAGAISGQVGETVNSDAGQTAPLLDEDYLTGEIDSLGVGTLSNLLVLFRQDTEAAFAEFEAHAAVGEWPAVAKRAHRLAGAAGNLGFSSVIAQARQLETAAGGANADAAAVTHMINTLRESCRLSCASLADKLAAMETDGRKV